MSVGWIFSTCHKNWLTSEKYAYGFCVGDGFLITVKLGTTMIKPIAATNKWSEKKWYGVFSCWKKNGYGREQRFIFIKTFLKVVVVIIIIIFEMFQKNLIDPTPHFWTVVYISYVYMLVFLHVIFMLIPVFVCGVLVLFVLYLYPVSVEMPAAWFHDLLCSKVISSGVSIPVYCVVINTHGMSCLRH